MTCTYSDSPGRTCRAKHTRFIARFDNNRRERINLLGHDKVEKRDNHKKKLRRHEEII